MSSQKSWSLPRARVRAGAGHARPARHVAISASHELFPSEEAALACIVEKRVVAHRRMRDQQHGRTLRAPVRIAATRMERTLQGGVDDLKFLYPLLDNIPAIAFPILHFATCGVQVSVYGPPEVGQVVEVLRDYLVSAKVLPDAQHLLYVPEDPRHRSFFHSIRGASEALGAQAADTLVWSAGDIVLAYDVFPWLMEPELGPHDLVLNVGAKQRVFPDGQPELFLGNYYETLIPRGGDARALDVKDPNLLGFTRAGLRGLSRLDDLRGAKDSSAYMDVFLRTAWRALASARGRACLSTLHYGLRRQRGSLPPGEGLRQDHASDFASAFFGVRACLKADTVDPFVLKDCDNLEDLFGFYRGLLQGIVDEGATREEGYHKLARYHPHAEHLLALSRRLEPLWHELPLWRHWTELIRDKVATCNRRLTEALRAEGLHDGTPPVPEYFAADGTFQQAPAPGDDLPGTRAFLRDVYLPRFQRGRATFQAAVQGGLS
ncbi:hypothetical protein HV824_15905 [Myxococcus sp. AM009]|uniref:hypothetical protein n=1 Tax=unclassified Myxococcus TaxID=2648731 RepID=UPI001595D01E|nr:MULTISPECIES: hypothetical protein [unclassified Myxococcus]NVI99597.1 hypothetical protein [Myxococcus sp. AM009]NVJ17097.1 hypothetical protein [Myxococcus sp. AM010]